MAKQPTFMFYPGDWLQDTRSLSCAAKGAWIDLLCAMWNSQTRGELSMPIVGYARLIGATVDQTVSLIQELIDMRVCDLIIHGEPAELESCHDYVTQMSQRCHAKVTLRNRRMYNEEKLRISNCYRKQNQRSRQVSRKCHSDVTQKSHDCHGDVTLREEEKEREKENENEKEKERTKEKEKDKDKEKEKGKEEEDCAPVSAPAIKQPGFAASSEGKTPEKESAVKAFIDFYHEQFKTRFGRAPVITSGKDGKLVKSLLRTAPLPELKELLLEFFESDDEFIMQSGYTIGVFHSQVNKLIVARQEPIGRKIKGFAGLRKWLAIKEAEDEAKRQEEVSA